MSNRTSTLGALVFVGIVVAGGVAALNEAFTQTSPADGTSDQYAAASSRYHVVASIVTTSPR